MHDCSLCRLRQLREELGTSLMKNMVATGLLGACSDLPIGSIPKVVEEEFGRKGQTVVEKNIEAVSQRSPVYS